MFVTTIPLFYSIISTIRGRFGGNTIAFEMNHTYFANLLCRYGAGNGISFFIYNSFAILGVVWGMVKARGTMVMLLLWFLFPFCFLFFLGYKYFLHIRYFIYIFPIYLIFTAYGISILTKSTQYKLVIATLFLLINIIPLQLYYSMPAKMTDWKSVAGYITSNYTKDKVVLVESSFCVRELKYYMDKIPIHSVGGNKERFLQLCKISNVIYIDNSPIFDKFVFDLFKKRVAFNNPVFKKLGNRELIDWDKSWFSQANIRRYYPSVYLN